MSKKFIGLALLCGALALHSGFLQAVKKSDLTKRAQAKAAVREIAIEDFDLVVPSSWARPIEKGDPRGPGVRIEAVTDHKPELGLKVNMIIRDYDLDDSPYVYTIYQADGKTLFARVTANEKTKAEIADMRRAVAEGDAAVSSLAAIDFSSAAGGAGAPSGRSSRTGSVSSVDEAPASPASRGRSSTPVPSAPPALTPAAAPAPSFGAPPVMASAVASTTDPETKRSTTPTTVRRTSSAGALGGTSSTPAAIAAAPAPSTSPALTPAPAARAIAAPPAIARAAAPAPAPSAPPAAAYSAYRLPTVKRSDLIAGTTVTPGKLPSSGSITTNTYTITKITNDKLKTQGVQEGMFSLDKDFSSANYLYSEYAGGTRDKAVEIVDDAASSRRRVAPPAAGGAGELPVL